MEAACAIPNPGRPVLLGTHAAPSLLQQATTLYRQIRFRPPLPPVANSATAAASTISSISCSCASPSVASSFTAEAPIGAVECYARGCRPVYDDEEACPAYMSDSDDDDEGEEGEAEAICEPPLVTWQQHVEMGGGLSMACQMERLLSSGGLWAEVERAERYYESALRLEPRNALLLLEYALFVWNALADVPRADDLFHRALHVAPTNHSILASYASFLWQTDA